MAEQAALENRAVARRNNAFTGAFISVVTLATAEFLAWKALVIWASAYGSGASSWSGC